MYQLFSDAAVSLGHVMFGVFLFLFFALFITLYLLLICCMSCLSSASKQTGAKLKFFAEVVVKKMAITV